MNGTTLFSLAGLVYWSYLVAAFICLRYIGRLGFDVLQGSRPCSPGAIRVSRGLTLVAGSLTVNPILGTSPTIGGLASVVAMAVLLWVFSGGQYRLQIRPKPGGPFRVDMTPPPAAPC